MKKPLLYLICIGISLAIILPVNASECDEELNEILDDILNDPDFVGFDEPLPIQTTCFKTVDILKFIAPPTEGFDIVAALREDLYKKTAVPIIRRSLLDEPALMPDYDFDRCWSVNTNLFYSFSPRVYFTKNSPFIRDYIDLSNENIINQLNNALKLIGQAFGGTDGPDIDVPGVLGLFSTIKLQQHRIGLMLGFTRQWDHWLFTARIPLYYQLEHFFLTDDEKRRIANNPFFTTDDAGEGVSPQDEVEKFLIRHLVSDKFGVGDTRLSLLGHFYASPCKNLWFGLQATLPTAKTFTRAFIGGAFNPDDPIPPFDLQHFFNLKCHLLFDLPPEQAGRGPVADQVFQTELTDFLLCALDRLSTILINAPLGNGKHFGLGAQGDFRYIYNDYFSTHTYAAVEAYLPHKDTRFFLAAKTEEDLVRDWQDPDMAGANLALLNRLIVGTLFPLGIRTVIFPGVKFQANHAFLYKSKHWDLKLGFDYWYQAREEMTPLAPIIPCNIPLVIPKAFRPAAQQGKIFGSVGYCDIMDNCVDWHVSLNADGTVFHKGIGANATASIRIGFEF